MHFSMSNSNSAIYLAAALKNMGVVMVQVAGKMVYNLHLKNSITHFIIHAYCLFTSKHKKKENREQENAKTNYMMVIHHEISSVAEVVVYFLLNTSGENITHLPPPAKEMLCVENAN